MKDPENKPIDINEKINRQEISITDKINSFFSKIDFLELPGEKKAIVALKVKNDGIPDKLYWIEIFLSGVIAALGLLQNSVAVVIGAMLIAPLLRPINSISYAISIGEKKLYWITVRVLIYSILLSIVTGFFSVQLSGLNIETSEIIARTSPNIIDLFIAIFSAMIAVLSLRFDRLGESIAGVAIAASLMPPLAVIGIELALLNFNLAFGAFMLFFANLVSIIIVGMIFFWMYGFSPKTGIKQKNVITKTIFVIITIIIVSIPLIHSLINIKQKVEINKKTVIYLENLLKDKSEFTRIKELVVEKLSSDSVKIYSVISVPEGLDFYDTFKTEIDNELTNKLGKNVELNIELIRTANIISGEKTDKEKELIDNLEQKLNNTFESKINESLDRKTLEQQEILKEEIVDKIRDLLKQENIRVLKVVE